MIKRCKESARFFSHFWQLALFRGNAQVNLILIGRRVERLAPYCYAINSVTSLVAVTDNVVDLVGKALRF